MHVKSTKFPEKTATIQQWYPVGRRDKHDDNEQRTLTNLEIRNDSARTTNTKHRPHYHHLNEHVDDFEIDVLDKF